MERKAIGIQGISTGSNYDDGACLNMMNMRHEQGVLKPVESYPVDYILKHVYDLLYWHKNNDYAHLIGVRNNGIYWIQNPGAVSEAEGTPLLAVTGTVTISHIGNIINVLDGDVLKYIFWQNGAYHVIDMDIDGDQSDTELLGKVDIRVNGLCKNEVPLLKIWNGTDKQYSNYAELSSSENTKLRAEEYKGLMIKSGAMLEKNGYLCGFHLAQTAIELFDGSFILNSPPILLGEAFDKKQRYDLTTLIGNRNYLSEDRLNFYTVTDLNVDPDLVYNADTESYDKPYMEAEAVFRNWERVGGIVNEHTQVTTDFPDGGYFWHKLGQASKTKVIRTANELQFNVNSNINESLRPLIKSISIFITPQISIYDFEKTATQPLRIYAEYSGGVLGYVENYYPYTKTNNELLKELTGNQQFYKVHEITFDDIKTTTENDGWVTIDLKGKLGDNLLTQQELTTASFSNIKARNQMTYNSMLHAWDIKNVVSRGWPLTYFKAIDGVGQFPVITETGNGGITNGDVKAYIQVKIKTNEGISTVVRTLSIRAMEFGSLNPILTYPDRRATEMTIYEWYLVGELVNHNLVYTGRILKKTFPLKEGIGNFAYYVDPDLKPINLPSTITDELYENFPLESNQELSYQNKLKVSNTNNPFLFPDGQTYQIGDGTILNVASQSIRTSDGQFGQYPLVCFCTDGVFTLQVGDGTVAYSKVGTPQNYERPISKVICVTPYGIAFISNRGLCMVVGQDIEYLSESMFEKFRTITLEVPEQIENLFALDLSSFNDYLKACTAMVYNPKEQEIIIINPAKVYNYVYNMGTKQFYRNTEVITNEINNSLPDMQVWTGATIKKVTVIEAGSRSISFVTRPIKMQTPDMKRFERVILRAYLSGITGTPATACIWGSIDDRNFKLLRGMVLENNSTRKDIDFGLFGKTTYRSYIIGLSMTVGTDSEIEAIEMQVEKEFLDTKMR